MKLQTLVRGTNHWGGDSSTITPVAISNAMIGERVREENHNGSVVPTKPTKCVTALQAKHAGTLFASTKH